MVLDRPKKFLTFFLFLSSCAVTSDRASRFCESSLFLVDAQFEGGSFDRCSFTSPGTVEITVRPEDRPPINESPWYAFRVTAKVAKTIAVGWKGAYDSIKDLAKEKPDEIILKPQELYLFL